jgi:hypothetical protein
MTTNIDLTNRLYKVGDAVYFGYKALNVHNQRGRLFVCYRDKQVNLKDIPVLPKDEKPDPVFNYIFTGQSATHPCHAMDYWIRRHRLKQDIRPWQYKAKYIKTAA